MSSSRNFYFLLHPIFVICHFSKQAVESEKQKPKTTTVLAQEILKGETFQSCLIWQLIFSWSEVEWLYLNNGSTEY